MAYKQLKLWFDSELTQMLAQKINEIDFKWDSKPLTKGIQTELDKLELKDRVELIADRLYQSFNKDYTKGLAVLMQILGPENEEETGMFTNFYWIMPIAKYVEKYGLNNFDLSIKAIEEITKRNTGEYTIRPFIEKHPNRTMAQMLKWSKNKSKHIRRLSSEGGRPRLPWASKLQMFIDNPQPLIPILNNLKNDSSKYVQKSVANCLNDILKDNEPIGRQIIQSWNNKPTKQCQWIIKHALRNFIKKEEAWALKITNSLG